MIFITENDVIGDDEPLYMIEKQIINTGKAFDDGQHIIYVNGSDRDAATALGRLMNDFFCTSADDMHYKILADRVRYYKEDAKGVETMCKVIEDMRAEVRAEVRKETKYDAVDRIVAAGLADAEKACMTIDVDYDEYINWKNRE